MLLKAIISTFS